MSDFDTKCGNCKHWQKDCTCEVLYENLEFELELEDTWCPPGLYQILKVITTEDFYCAFFEYKRRNNGFN